MGGAAWRRIEGRRGSDARAETPGRDSAPPYRPQTAALKNAVQPIRRRERRRYRAYLAMQARPAFTWARRNLRSPGPVFLAQEDQGWEASCGSPMGVRGAAARGHASIRDIRSETSQQSKMLDGAKLNCYT